MGLGEPGEAGLIGQGAGDLVGNGLRLRSGVGPAAGIAVMNCRDSPACSAAPQSSAQRSSLRAWLKVMARVVVVTTEGVLPSWRRIASDASPSRSRCRWSAANRWMCAAVSSAGSWPPPGASTARNAARKAPVAARRKASKVPPVRGQPGERSRSAR